MQEVMEIIKLGFDERIDIEIPCNIEEVTENTFSKLVLKTASQDIVLCHDCLGYIINSIVGHCSNIDKIEVSTVFKDIDIGLAQNEYYQYIQEEKQIDKPYLKEAGDFWIGNKFCMLEDKRNSTWIYKEDCKIVFKVTPLYSWHFEEEALYTYETFVKQYHVLYMKSLTEFQIEVILSRLMKIRDKLQK